VVEKSAVRTPGLDEVRPRVLSEPNEEFSRSPAGEVFAVRYLHLKTRRDVLKVLLSGRLLHITNPGLVDRRGVRMTTKVVNIDLVEALEKMPERKTAISPVGAVEQVNREDDANRQGKVSPELAAAEHPKTGCSAFVMLR